MCSFFLKFFLWTVTTIEFASYGPDFFFYILYLHIPFLFFLLQCVLILSGVCAIRFSSDSKFSSLSFFFYNLLQNTKKYLSSFFSKQKLCYYVISKISFLWLWLIKKYQTSKEEWNSLHLVLPKRQYPLTIPLSSNSVCFWIRYTACIIWNMMDLDLELVMLIMVWIFADWTLPFSSVGDVLRSKTCCGFLYRK